MDGPKVEFATFPEGKKEEHPGNQNHVTSNIRNVTFFLPALLAWIFTILLPMIIEPKLYDPVSNEDYLNSLSVHNRLKQLNVSTSKDFDGFKNTNQPMIVSVSIFGVPCILFVYSIVLTINFNETCSRVCRVVLFIICILVSLAATGAIGYIAYLVHKDYYVKLLAMRIDPYKTDSYDLHEQMIYSLNNHFLNDNLTTVTEGNISTAWNKLFMDYECCGVNKVSGTTNDFDGTPWCTTSGSCQATASQIPKTCCKGVTEHDYQNAPTNCHSSVNPGEYYEKGCFAVIKDKVIQERTLFNPNVDYLIRDGLQLVIVMVSYASLCLVCGMLRLACEICVSIRVDCCKTTTNNTTTNKPEINKEHEQCSTNNTTNRRVGDRRNPAFQSNEQDVNNSTSNQTQQGTTTHPPGSQPHIVHNTAC